MNEGFRKYIPFRPEKPARRLWPERVINAAPVWCSVDLRDGNQALVNPMDIDEKIEFFKMLTKMGFKEIEAGFPASSDMEFAATRALIDGGHIPDDVYLQVLTQAKPELVRRTFQAIKGAKKVIFNFYNPISTLQRKVVFHSDMQGVTDIAMQSARLIRELGDKCREDGMDLIYEYSPESFSGTEMDNAAEICSQVALALGASPERKVILNLTATVEGSMPNQFADQIEYFLEKFPLRDSVIISVHPHNDRGTGVAAAELAQLAGAVRVEGTLFGNGERSGNVDLVTLALNLYTQGIDPGLNLSHLVEIRDIYERITGIRVPERQPYSGQLAFTAFSGSHQDAINKGLHYVQETTSPYWEVPYIPIDPADIGRQYDPIIRINSQSGKGGAAFVLESSYGYVLPRAMRPEFGALVKDATLCRGTDLTPEDIFSIFKREYMEISGPYKLLKYRFTDGADDMVSFWGQLGFGSEVHEISGDGNGPIDAFFNAVSNLRISDYHFLSYSEHAVSTGSDSRAVAYIQLRASDGATVFGVGMSHNIYTASIRGIICAINRDIRRRG